MGTIKKRLLRLERNAEIERTALMKRIQYHVFEAMRLSDEDRKLLHVITDRGEACTPEEQAAWDRFSAERERAFKIVSSRV
jgi:hypothetical protein